MECKFADELMMKYMDGMITEKEANHLHDHLSQCDACTESFKVYDDILADFAEAPLYEAPDGFEEAVMAKVAACEVPYQKRAQGIDNLFTFAVGFVSVLFGIGFLLVMNREQIIHFMENSELFGGYARVISPMLNLVLEYTSNFMNAVIGFAVTMSGFVSDFRFIILAGCVALLATQYMIRKKGKVGA